MDHDVTQEMGHVFRSGEARHSFLDRVWQGYVSLSVERSDLSLSVGRGDLSFSVGARCTIFGWVRQRDVAISFRRGEMYVFRTGATARCNFLFE
jgi:hypothetical protein